MKKSYKPIIVKYVLFIGTMILFILIYVGLKLKIDFMLKEIVALNQDKKAENNLNLNLYVEYQDLTSEERIRSIAINELGMVAGYVPYSTIEINKEKIKKADLTIRKKYEHK
jgi:cell division protein FtsL